MSGYPRWWCPAFLGVLRLLYKSICDKESSNIPQIFHNHAYGSSAVSYGIWTTEGKSTAGSDNAVRNEKASRVYKMEFKFSIVIFFHNFREGGVRGRKREQLSIFFHFSVFSLFLWIKFIFFYIPFPSHCRNLPSPFTLRFFACPPWSYMVSLLSVFLFLWICTEYHPFHRVNLSLHYHGLLSSSFSFPPSRPFSPLLPPLPRPPKYTVNAFPFTGLHYVRTFNLRSIIPDIMILLFLCLLCLSITILF